MKIGYLPKVAGPREEELLASINTPSVRSYIWRDFSVAKTNSAPAISGSRPAMVQQSPSDYSGALPQSRSNHSKFSAISQLPLILTLSGPEPPGIPQVLARFC